MRKKLLLSLFMVSLVGVGCDDDEPTPPRDGSVSEVRPDAGPDATTDAADARPDTTADAVDARPDTTPDAVDARPDTTPDVTATDTAPDATTTDTAPDTAPDAAPDAVTTPDLLPDAVITTDATGVDGGPLALNGCVAWLDGREGTDPNMNRYIEWNNTTYPTSMERCIQIRVGQSVIFGPTDPGTFATHPLAPSEGGNSPAIPGRATGDDDYEVTFSTPGTFGYHCTSHPTTMRGAVHVVP